MSSDNTKRIRVVACPFALGDDKQAGSQLVFLVLSVTITTSVCRGGRYSRIDESGRGSTSGQRVDNALGSQRDGAFPTFQETRQLFVKSCSSNTNLPRHGKQSLDCC